MKAGRELDALVAEKVMGLIVPEWGEDTLCPYCGSEMRYCGTGSRCSTCQEWRYGRYKEYSTDIAAAWEVVERLCNWDVDDNMLVLKGQGPDLEKKEWPDGEAAEWWEAEIGGTWGKVVAEAEKPALAICLAALKAKGINE